jgi:hypothetical protein
MYLDRSWLLSIGRRWLIDNPAFRHEYMRFFDGCYRQSEKTCSTDGLSPFEPVTLSFDLLP